MSTNAIYQYRGARFVLKHRKNGYFYSFDKMLREWKSLKVKDEVKAQERIVALNKDSKDDKHNMLMFEHYKRLVNLPKVTWSAAMKSYGERTDIKAPTLKRVKTAFRSKAFDSIRELNIADTSRIHLQPLLSSNVGSHKRFMRQLHNYALSQGWLPVVLIPAKSVKIKKQNKARAITWDEHQKLLATETREEWPEFLKFLWITGASQSDAAELTPENFADNILSFDRMKTANPCGLEVGEDLRALLDQLPKHGHLFPKIRAMGQGQRSSYFRRRCNTKQVGISGVSLKSYRNSFAKRAREAEIPKEKVMAALGHKSQNVHEEYAKGAVLVCPALPSKPSERFAA